MAVTTHGWRCSFQVRCTVPARMNWPVRACRQTGSPVSINGLNNKSSGWFVDGAYDMNIGNGEANTHVPPIDSLAEVQIQTANYSARYGTTGGAVITSVTKSGTSQFHGSAYEYLRNDAMDARNFFAQSNPPLRQNQSVFIGGPVLLPHYNEDRNKTFFSGMRNGASAGMH